MVDTEAAQAEFETRGKQLQETKSALDAKTRDCTELTGRLHEATKALSEARQGLVDTDHRVRQLEAESVRVRELKDELVALMDSARASCTTFSSMGVKNGAELEELYTSLRAAQDMVKMYERAAVEKHGALEKLKQEHAELGGRCASLEKAAEDLEVGKEAIERTLRGRESELVAAQQAVTQLDGQVRAVRETLAQRDAELACAVQALQVETSARAADAARHAQALVDAHAATADALAVRDEAAQTAQAALSARVAEAIEAAAHAQEQLAEMAAARDEAARQAVAALQSERERARAQLQSAEAAAAEQLRVAEQAASETVGALRRQCELAEERHRDVVRERKGAEEKLRTQMAHALQQETDGRDATIAALQSEIKSLQTQMTQASKSAATAAERAQDEVRDAKKERDEARAKVTEMTAQLVRAQAAADSARATASASAAVLETPRSNATRPAVAVGSAGVQRTAAPTPTRVGTRKGDDDDDDDEGYNNDRGSKIGKPPRPAAVAVPSSASKKRASPGSKNHSESDVEIKTFRGHLQGQLQRAQGGGVDAARPKAKKAKVQGAKKKLHQHQQQQQRRQASVDEFDVQSD